MDKLINKIDEEIAKIEVRIRQTAKERDESATPMESASDQTRQIANQLYNSLLEEKAKMMRLRSRAKKFSTVYKLGYPSLNSTKKFLIVPDGLGGIIAEDLVFLSESSPLAKLISAKKVGDEFSFNNTTIVLEDIC